MTALSTISYGPSARHKIDIYTARGKFGTDKAITPNPVLVFIYGGSWKTGERGIYKFLGRAFAAKGFTVAVPDYHLYPEARFPHFVEDVALALQWIKNNIGQYGGDPARLHLMGHSAGAHTGALICLQPEFLARHNMSAADIRSFTGVAGPYSFNPMEFESVRPVFEHLDDIDHARPIKHAHGKAPPMLLLHSKRDRTVGIHNSQFLRDAITEKGGRIDHRAYPLVGHVGIIASVAGPLRFLAPAFRDTLSFITQIEQSHEPMKKAEAPGELRPQSA